MPRPNFSPFAPKTPPFPAKAKRVIHIFANGAPSQMDTWDPKPALAKFEGKSIGGGGVAMPSPFKFQKHGRSGIEVSEVFPNLAKHVDEMAIIRSMHTDIPAHEIATVMMNTGSRQLAKPSLGSWAVYGLGQREPKHAGLHFAPERRRAAPMAARKIGVLLFCRAFIRAPASTRRPRAVEEMIQNIKNPYVSTGEQRRQLDLIHQLNELHAQSAPERCATRSAH